MSRKWVVNASPLIILAKVGHLSLLHELSSELVIPSAVRHEIIAGPVDDPARTWLQKEGMSWVREDVPIPRSIAGWDLGAGETGVLAWAHSNPGSEVIVDDRAARNCASAMAIPARGTVGVVILAKVQGLVPAAEPLLSEIVAAGLRIDQAVLEKAL